MTTSPISSSDLPSRRDADRSRRDRGRHRDAHRDQPDRAHGAVSHSLSSAATHEQQHRRRVGPPAAPQRPTHGDNASAQHRHGAQREPTRAAPSSRRDRDDGDENRRRRRKQMIQAAVTAAAVELMQQHGRAGDWVGEKGVRVATAAISAAVIDAGIDKDPSRGAAGNIMKSTIGALIIDKLANGGRR